MTKTRPSFVAGLSAQLNAYAVKAEPIHVHDQSQRYVRAIVSSYNTSNGRQFSVIQYGTGLLVGLRPHIQAYMRKQLPGPQEAVQPAKALSAAEHLSESVHLFMASGLSTDEIRAQLNTLLTNIDMLGI